MRWRPHTSLLSPWSAVYAAMGLASWLVWRHGGFAAQSLPLALYGSLLLAVYMAWPPAFVSGNQLYAALDAMGKIPRTVHPVVFILHLVSYAHIDAACDADFPHQFSLRSSL